MLNSVQMLELEVVAYLNGVLLTPLGLMCCSETSLICKFCTLQATYGSFKAANLSLQTTDHALSDSLIIVSNLLMSSRDSSRSFGTLENRAISSSMESAMVRGWC